MYSTRWSVPSESSSPHGVFSKNLLHQVECSWWPEVLFFLTSGRVIYDLWPARTWGLAARPIHNTSSFSPSSYFLPSDLNYDSSGLPCWVSGREWVSRLFLSLEDEQEWLIMQRTAKVLYWVDDRIQEYTRSLIIAIKPIFYIVFQKRKERPLSGWECT